jgi:Flp pilus assembly pilin Flp
MMSDETGATMIEYALLLLWIAMLVASAAWVFGQNLARMFDYPQIFG